MEIDELRDGQAMTHRINIPEVAGRIVEDDGLSMLMHHFVKSMN
jgi:hypothetical protein